MQARYTDIPKCGDKGAASEDNDPGNILSTTRRLPTVVIHGVHPIAPTLKYKKIATRRKSITQLIKRGVLGRKRPFSVNGLIGSDAFLRSTSRMLISPSEA
jgi:hypothetical protein